MITIGIINDKTGDDKLGNYTFEVLVNDDRIAEGHVTGHDRADNWQKLLARLISQNGLDNPIEEIDLLAQRLQDQRKHNAALHARIVELESQLRYANRQVRRLERLLGGEGQKDCTVYGATKLNS